MDKVLVSPLIFKKNILQQKLPDYCASMFIRTSAGHKGYCNIRFFEEITYV